MEAMRPDEVTHHTEVQNLVRGQCRNSRCSRDRHKGIYLTKGDLPISRISREVSRGHSSHWERAVRATEVSQGDEGLNVKFVPNAIGRFTDSESASPVIGGTGKIK